MNEYWIAVDGKKVGPIRVDKLRNKIIDNEVLPETLCWTSGMDNWRPIQELSEFKTLLQSKLETTETTAEEAHETGAIPPVSAEAEVSQEPILEAPRTSIWKRAVAKLVDSVVISTLIVFITSALGINFIEFSRPGYFWPSIFTVLSITLAYETLAVHFLRTTWGKFLMGIEIRSSLDNHLTLLQSCLRATRSWFSSGLVMLLIPGFSILALPLIVIFHLMNQWFYSKTGYFKWDYEDKHKVTPISSVGAAQVGLLIISVLSLFFIHSLIITPHLIAFLENHPEELQNIQKLLPGFSIEDLKKP